MKCTINIMEFSTGREQTNPTQQSLRGRHTSIIHLCSAMYAPVVAVCKKKLLSNLFKSISQRKKDIA